MNNGGYTGKILRVDLTSGKVSTIDTAKYEKWGGGHGIGSAIFFDLCTDKTIDGFDPKNVVTIMTSPLSGTSAPAVAGRTEVQGISVQGYPKPWFSRSNFGGRFSGMLKYAGWDGIVIEGKASKPVWIDIRNGDVQIKDAKGVWGLDTTAAQEEIWRRVQGENDGSWVNLGTSRDSGRTTQRPAVLTAGRAGENMSRMGSLLHDAGNGAGQGGFGGVFGSKNLKAVSVIGTGSVRIADPNALIEAREWSNTYAVAGHWDSLNRSGKSSYFADIPSRDAVKYAPVGQSSAPQGCLGCHRSCRTRYASGMANGSQCVDFLFYNSWDKEAHGGEHTQTILNATDAMQRAGLNAYELEAGIIWLVHLYKLGIVGPGKEIDSDLPFDKVGQDVFVVALIDCILDRTDIGAVLTNGLARAAEHWGRFDEDTATGILPLQEWGYPQHYDARAEVEWGYGSILDARDINGHDFNTWVYWAPSLAALTGTETVPSAKDLAEIMGEKLSPYNDPMMMDYSDEGIYSEAMVKLVAWHRHYTRYWKDSILYCDWAYGDYYNQYGPKGRGITGEAEPRFLNAVTGGKITFEQGMELGRKIWNLDRAIWFLQGRHRDQEVFAAYNYDTGAVPGFTTYEIPYVVPVFENGEWSYKNVAGRMLDRVKVEEFKTKFFAFEGWDTSTGAPTRKTLESLGLGDVADALEAAGKLGK